MFNGYIVKYFLANKKNDIYSLFVAARDKEDARNKVTVQAHHRHGGKPKVNIVSVEGEK